MGELFTHSPFADTSHSRAPEPDPNAERVPPPPENSIEVTIRTMQSDLDLMAKSGGGLQAAQVLQNIALARPERMSFTSGEPAPAPRSSGNFMAFVWIGLGILGATLLFFAGYYLIPVLLPVRVPAPAAPAPTPADLTHTLPTSTPPSVFTHKSIFSQPLDEHFALTLGPEAGTSRGAYLAQIKTLLASAKPTSKLVEVELKNSDNHPLSWTKFLNAVGIKPNPPDFWTSRTEEDFTLYFVRVGAKLLPAYALSLKSGTSPLVLKNDLITLETDVSFFPNLYVENPGSPTSGFADAQLAGQAVRTLHFATSSPTLVYGFPFGKYLLVSTSEDGYKNVLTKF